MSGFSEATLSQKLSELNQTAPSIQGVSLWLLHHRKHYHAYVKVIHWLTYAVYQSMYIFFFQLWYKELGKIKQEQKLPMMYLANDLVQNSRKKYPEIAKEFGTVMKLVFTHLVALNLDAKTQNSINRLVNIWRERQIFDKKILSDMSTVWESRAQKAPVSDEPTRKKRKSGDNSSVNGGSSGGLIDFDQTSDDVMKFMEILNATSDLDSSEELLSSLPDLSSIFQVELSADESKEKLSQLSEAENQLQEQSKVIQEEIDRRQYLEKLMSNFLKAQKLIVNKKKERLKNCKTKLNNIDEAKKMLENQLLSESLVEAELESIPLPNDKSVSEDKPSSSLSDAVNDDVDDIPLPIDQ